MKLRKPLNVTLQNNPVLLTHGVESTPATKLRIFPNFIDILL